MSEVTKKKSEHLAPSRELERRRIGTVVHDDRGCASVSWRDAPDDYDRPVLEVVGEPSLSIKSEESYDPYAHRAAHTSGSGATAGGASSNSSRTNLRKLSEWIKMMRELEQRKRTDAEQDPNS